MGFILRASLVLSAFLVLLFVTRKIRKAQFGTTDALFWLFLSACLLLVAVFPGIAFFFSGALGIQSPSNFVFLAVIALLLIREFSMQVELADLRRKVIALTQETALAKNSSNSQDAPHSN